MFVCQNRTLASSLVPTEAMGRQLISKELDQPQGCSSPSTCAGRGAIKINVL